MKALYALCLSLAAFAFARPAQAELKYLSYEVQSGTVKELTAEEVEKLDVTDKRWHETISTTTEDGTQTKTTEMLFVQDTDISTEYYIGVFEVTQAQASQLRLGGTTGTYGYAYGVAYSNTGFPFATTPTLNNKPGLSFPTPDQWLAYASGTNRSLATSPQSATNLRGGGSLSSFYSLTEWYNNPFKWRTGANIHGVIDIFGNAAEYTCDPGKGEDGSDIVAFYGWPTYHGSDYSWKKLEELTSPSETRLDAYNIVGDITNIWGARLVYTVPAARTYTLTVTLDGTEVSKQEGLNEGTSVTVTPPEVAEWHRLSGCTITPPQENLQPPTGEALGRPYPFQMPAADLTFAYTSEPYGTITVEGGTAKVTHGEETVTAGKNTQVVEGDTVTLKADEPGQYQFFSRWDGVQPGENDPITVGEELMGKETTIEAVYQYYPRVLVVGGTATVAEADAENSFGNGYYAMGTVLTLEAETLSGYKFSGWTVDKADMADALDTERGTYTIGANDAGTTVTLTATYEYDESGESGTVTPADIHLGSTLAEGVYTAHPLFGWTPRTMETTVTDETSNRYHVYPYVAAGLYANLDLTTGKVVYSDSLSQGETSGGSSMPSPPQQWQYDDFDAYLAAFEAWEKEWNDWAENRDSETFNAKRLPLRRVIPTDGATEFYLGVYETAMGHVENLNAFRAGNEPKSSDAAAYCGKHGGDEVCENWPSAFNTLRNNLNDTFFGGATRVRYPTQNDLLRVAQTSITDENPDAGKGYPSDKNLTSAMVIGGGSTAKPDNVNAMTPCYGFYGLWGNGWETDKDGNGFAGSAYYSHTAQRAFWTSTVEPLTYPGVQSFATFRPAIDVEEAVVIYVGEKNSAKAVQVAPGQDLFADPSVLPTKTLSRCTGWTLGDTKIKAGENHTVTTEDDGKVLVPTWEETPVSIPVKCENCLGPETAYPGQTVTVYPLEGMAFAAESPLTSSNSDVEVGTPAADGTLTVTFPDTLPLDSKITLTGKLVPIEEPEPEPEVKPGYRFRLR